MTEEWRGVPSTGGTYEASSLGRVRSVDRIVLRSDGVYRTFSGTVLSPSVQKNGYHKIVLHLGGKRSSKWVHRVVAEAFFEATGHVDHIDFDRSNNAPRNLRIVTVAENTAHTIANLRHAYGERNGRAKLTEDIVREMRTAFASGAKVRVLAKKYGVDRMTAKNAIERKTWKRVY